MMAWHGRVVLTLGTPGCLFEDVVKTVVSGGGQVAGVMHTRIADLAPALEIVKPHWPGPLMAYAETGHFVTLNWVWEGTETPDGYLEFVLGWIAMGVQVVGGCCGTMPEHIRRLREGIPKRLPN